ncbi:MAG: hypothetical protein DMG32_03935 [Acidobacteria bacterium]|nr:MAG: hypothetical protein DMG32_03935 [Acidobacteriota bacterium]
MRREAESANGFRWLAFGRIEWSFSNFDFLICEFRLGNFCLGDKRESPGDFGLDVVVALIDVISVPSLDD